MKVAKAVLGSFVSFGLALAAFPGGTPLTPSPLAGAGTIASTSTRAAAGSAAPMTGRTARAANKNARAAMQSGRLVDALRQYEKVIAGTPAAEPSRGEALYWAGLLRVSPDPALRDIDRARAYLGELKVFHGAAGHQDEAGILLALTEEMGDTKRSAESLRDELAARGREVETCRTAKDDLSGRLQSALGENETLKESDSARRAEIQGLRDEVKRKDEALRKVKEVVVGWKAPR
jgi:hypothetical protein